MLYHEIIKLMQAEANHKINSTSKKQALLDKG